MPAPGSTNLLQRRTSLSQKLDIEFTFFVTKVNPPGKKTSLSQLLTVCSPDWTSRMQNKVTINYCQHKERQPFIIFCFTHTHTQNLADILGLLTEDGCPVLQTLGWDSCFCHISQFGNPLFALLTQLILFPSWVSE